MAWRISADAGQGSALHMPVNAARPLTMHIDLNSCFATIEQQSNPLYRNKPLGVAAYDSPGGIILAASYEAKALGIRLGTSVREARQIHPGIIVLMPDPPKYRTAHKRFQEVLSAYTSNVVPKSIDEFVVDFRGSEAVRQGRSMEDVGYEIKRRIREHLGEYVSVNVGIGPNRFLAKLAAGLHKPDGLDAITHDNLPDVLGSVGLMDLPGINRRFKARLFAAGITTPLEMFQADAKYLKHFVFFSKLGYHWHMRLRGWEVDDVEFERRTIGHQYALKEKSHDRDYLCRLLMKLCEKVGRRLRRSGRRTDDSGSHTGGGDDNPDGGHPGYVAYGIHLSMRFANHQYWHHGHKTEGALYATQDIYRAAAEMLRGIPQFPDSVTHLSVTVFNIRPKDPEQLGLFDETPLRRRRLAEAADIVNDKYGEFTVVPASMANMQKLILDRIAWGSIKDMD